MIMRKEMTQQLGNDILSNLLAENTGKFVGAIFATTAFQLVLNTCFSHGMARMMRLVDALYLISFSMLINLNLPANVQLFTNTMFFIINADVIDPTWSTELFFNFEDDLTFVSEKITEGAPLVISKNAYGLGFEAFNPIFNIGGLFIILLILFSGMVVGASFMLLTGLYRKLIKFKPNAVSV